LTCASALELFEDEDPGTLPHHEAVAVLVEGAGGVLGGLVSGGEGLGGREARDREPRGRRLRAAGHDDVGLARADGEHRHPDRVARGRARARGREGGPEEPEADRDLAADGVGHDLRDEVRAHAARPALEQAEVLLLDAGDPADPRADDRAEAFALLLRDGREVETGIGRRLLRRLQRVHRERVELAEVGPGEAGFRVPVHHRREGDRQVGHVEARDRRDPVLAGEHPPPGGLHVGSQGVDGAQSRDHDSSHGDSC
jgi:hypothetical protein